MQAATALNEGDEAEDFQAVGMRLRECLISFVQETAGEATVPEGSERPKRSDFKGWAELLARAASPSSRGAQMRSYLRAMSRETWDLVNWLTHAANAKRSDADTAVDATSHLLQVFSLALIREKRGEPKCCPDCGSHQATTDYRRGGDEEVSVEAFLLCEPCGWERDDPVAAA